MTINNFRIMIADRSHPLEGLLEGIDFAGRNEKIYLEEQYPLVWVSPPRHDPQFAPRAP